jgi:phosphoserine aminotransferase
VTDRIFNFSAGPSTLPLEVLEQARDELVDHEGSGVSLLETSHRAEPYASIHREALQLAMELSGAPAEFEPLVIQGGATLQFAMLAANLLAGGGQGSYAVTGIWASKALQDGAMHGEVRAVWDGGPSYDRAPAPDELVVEGSARYLHVTANETIGGVRYARWPEVDVPLVADVSSEFMSRPVPWDRCDLVYGGVQKNLGPAGMALVFVRRSALESLDPQVASYLRYAVHLEQESLYNTPPVFSVWMLGKVLRWMRDQGGLAAMEAAAEARAAALYAAIDGSDGWYRCPVEPESRSVTNVVFRLPDAELEERFVAEAEASRLSGLQGHRSVGGCRASLYNAMPMAGVEALVAFMEDFHAANR